MGGSESERGGGGLRASESELGGSETAPIQSKI